MRRDRRIIGLRHARDQSELRNSTRVTYVGLEDRGGPLLENLPKSPFQEDALSGGERDVGFPGQLGHHIHVEGLHHLFVEPGLIRLQSFHQKHGRRRLHRAMKVDGDIDAGTLSLAESLESFGHFIDKLLPFDVLKSRPRGRRRNLHRVDTGSLTDRSIHPDSVARGAAQKLVYRHAIYFAFDIPERLIDAALNRGLDRPAAVKRAAANSLPVEDYAGGLLTYQIASDLQSAGGTGLGVVLEHLAPAGNSGVGRDLDEDPRVLQHKGLNLGHLDVVIRADRGRIGSFAGE